ncbi:MAG: LysR family transcriptional regulator [Bdellovibrionales bacterium RIFCSPHIGHO2_01_FULL_40_29]|nr:MAG: LysR family transcriptional regulator [Bdellovibrionales bacterium RIFCSPHIGHO2_01_FULL_40_29]OFZ32421.1 MAG: LysR family transcriptional regulator [Bdellovibrionales bacterium RIFCSPHIGHO2_02_FULL_40_15]
MEKWINYHHLYYFKTIAEEQSVSKAAIKLRLGQPTLSAQLKIFEDSLGVQLFERHHKKLTLTEHGKVALTYSHQIFALGTEMSETLQNKFKPAKPDLRIAALDSIPKQIVLKLVHAALKISPCQITLLEGKSDELIRDLRHHRIDLLITNFIPSSTETKGIFYRSIMTNSISFYGAPQFKHLKKKFPESLTGQPVLLPTYDSKLRFDLDHWRTRHAIDFEILSETQDIAVKELMAISGLGLLPAAAHSLSRQLQSKELIEIGKLDHIREEIFLVTADRKIENKITKELMRSFEF